MVYFCKPLPTLKISSNIIICHNEEKILEEPTIENLNYKEILVNFNSYLLQMSWNICI